MRVPTDLPRRRRAGTKGRAWLGAAVVALFVLLTSLRGLAGFYTDYLWFDELGFTSVFTGVITAKLGLVAAFTLAFFVLLYVNLVIAERLGPRNTAPPDEFVARYRETIAPFSGKVRVVVAAVFALLAGTGVTGQWSKWIMFRNGGDFAVEDPQFGRDIGFYMFKLPFLTFLANWVWVSIFIVAIVTTFAHYLSGGIRIQAARDRFTPQVKGHISVLLALAALARGALYWLQRFELNFSTRGHVNGAGYTDVKAQLPALELLFVISLVATVMFVVNIRRQGWVLPVIAVGLWFFVQVIVATLYPAFIQKFRVEPQESKREAPYIERNIAATRAALGIDGVKEVNYPYSTELAASDLATNAATIRNVRLWDPLLAKQTYQKLQGIRSYYELSNVDIDRYEIDGQITQTLVSAREIDPDNLPADSWINRHLEYTHGYGVVLAPANASSNGRPAFELRDVPPKGAPELKEPRIYYGESAGGYAIVNTSQPELDYQLASGGSQQSSYSGKGGVTLNSFARRVAFALRFGNPNMVLSNLITEESKAIYVRDIGERVRKAAPFLRYDSDPYPVILDGRILWIQDAYTTSTRYPYSQTFDTDRLPESSGLRGSYNYVRNSVKAVIDAYDGTVTFYIVDDEDPLARTYAKAFPKLFTPGERMDPELRRHLRYPEDLFRVQTNMYGKYHITDPGEFYQAGDAWNISQDPGSGPVTGEGARTTNVTVPGQNGQPPTVVSTREARMDPTYLLMRLPGEEKESFLILQPFVPSSQGDRQRNLSAFMVAKSDPGAGYGQLISYVMPRGQQINGPALAAAHIDADAEVSQQITLLGQRNSRVSFGNIVVVPIEDSLLFVRPLYVSSEATDLPELRKVIVVHNEDVAMADTLQGALAELFGDAPPTQEDDGETPETPTEGDAPTVAELLAQADAAFTEADNALRAGDLATYQKKIQEGVALTRRAREQSAPAGDSSAATTSTTAPSA